MTKSITFNNSLSYLIFLIYYLTVNQIKTTFVVVFFQTETLTLSMWKLLKLNNNITKKKKY